MPVNGEKVYSLPAHIRVRDEDFGLLFYNAKNTGLIFINSGDTIKANALKQGGTALELAPQNPAKGEALLEKLAARGLVNC